MQAITSISIKKLHGYQNINISLHHDVNIIYGPNGSGKTTLLHIIANALNRDYQRFHHLDFQSLEITTVDWVELGDQHQITPSQQHVTKLTKKPSGTLIIEQDGQSRTIPSPGAHLRQLRLTDYETGDEPSPAEPSEESSTLPVASYFPAFRTMIDAWHVERTKRYGRGIHWPYGIPARHEETKLARLIFGPFVPEIRFPSLQEVGYRFGNMVNHSAFRAAASARNIMTDAFVQAFAVLAGNSLDDGVRPPEQGLDAVMRDIQRHLADLESVEAVRAMSSQEQRGLYARLRQVTNKWEGRNSADSEIMNGILNVYRNALKQQLEAYKEETRVVDAYLSAVSKFLRPKQLVVRWGGEPAEQVLAVDVGTGKPRDLSILSSGERQIVTLLFAATRLHNAAIVLVDEPEISLHVEWQRDLVRAMVEQVGTRQVIVATHSPEIGAEWLERVVEVGR